jgi:threonine dehydratase
MVVCVGADGCKGGWVSAHVDDHDVVQFRTHADATLLLEAFPSAVFALDMPIGLPERTGAGGRGPERLIRPLLGERQSSVFSIPARVAVEAQTYADCCRLAQLTSSPPRKVSKQGFNLSAKIRDLDHALRIDSARAGRVHETHPELVFATLNGRPLATPKKLKGRINPDGMAQRRALLAGAGLVLPPLLPRLTGCSEDDMIDAAAALVAAQRIMARTAISYPTPPERDRCGLPIAIWA